MAKFIITTESGSDLPKEIQERWNIQVIPMYVTMGGETYPDGSFPVEQVFDYYLETQSLPQTSGSTPEDNSNYFRKITERYPGVQIIHIAYSAVTTVSFNSASVAAQDFDNVHLIDSKNVTMGLTAIIKAAAQFIENNPNTTAAEIVAFVEDIRDRTRFIFLPKTLTYLKAGGRVSNLAYHGAKILNLNPTITLENGYLVSGRKYRGSFYRSLNKTIADFFNDYDIDLATVIAGGSAGIESDDKEAALKLLEEQGIECMNWFETGAVISCHGGPGAFGIAGIEKA